ncbi:hypothetical protein HZS_130, partial [Henneguya salminicola]
MLKHWILLHLFLFFKITLTLKVCVFSLYNVDDLNMTKIVYDVENILSTTVPAGIISVISSHECCYNKDVCLLFDPCLTKLYLSSNGDVENIYLAFIRGNEIDANPYLVFSSAKKIAYRTYIWRITYRNYEVEFKDTGINLPYVVISVFYVNETIKVPKIVGFYLKTSSS